MTDGRITQSCRRIFGMNNIISCDARARDTKREKVTLRRYSLYLYRSHALDSLFLKGQPPIPPSPSFLCSELRRHGARRALAQRGQDPPRPPAGKYVGEEGGKFNLRQRRTNSGKRGGNEMVDIDERFFLGRRLFAFLVLFVASLPIPSVQYLRAQLVLLWLPLNPYQEKCL